MLLSLLFGCPPESGKPPSVDSGDTAEADTADTADTADIAGDTAVAFIQKVADWQVSGDPATLDVFHYGWAAWSPRASAWVCEARFPYAALGPASPGCPDCTWSFYTEAAEVSPSGPACDSLEDPRRGGGSLFDDIAAEGLAYSNFTNGTMTGFGFAPEYTLVSSSGKEYALTDALFWYYSGEDYHGWYLDIFDYQPFVDTYGETVLGNASAGEIGPSPWIWSWQPSYAYYSAL